MGPSGSGKTTLLKVAAGYLQPDEGQVNLLGFPIYDLKMNDRMAIRRRIGFMFQEDLLIDTLTLVENIELPLLIDGVGRKERRKIAEMALKLVGLEGEKERRPDQVSGGERRKASLLRCLVRSPQILFADEPTSNLDSSTALKIVEILKQLNRSGTTILVSTHDPLVAEHLRAVLHIRDGIITRRPMRKNVDQPE